MFSGSQRILSAWLEFLDPLLEIGMYVFMYHTKLAFIFMAGGMKPSVEYSKNVLVRSLKF